MNCRVGDVECKKRVIKVLTSISDGWTTNDLEFVWKDGDPVQVVKNLHLPRFTLEKFLTASCNSKTNTGTCKWPNLYVVISIK
jgi:hypothetical protein